MGIGTIVEGAVDDVLTTFVSAKSAALCSALLPVAISGVTIHLVIMGYAIMRGDANDSIHLLLSKWLRIAIVGSIALFGGSYQAVVLEAVNGLDAALIHSLTGSKDIGALIDIFTHSFETLGHQIWNDAVADIVPVLTLAAAAAITALAAFIIIPICLGMYILAKVGLALTLAVGPVFVLCALWPATEKYTESWIGQVINFTILKALISTGIALLSHISNNYAKHIALGASDINILLACAALFICTIALSIVFLNLPQLASALAGGASISGIGRDVGRFILHSFKRSEKEASDGGQIDRGREDGGGRGGGTNGERASSKRNTPLYQQNSLAQLKSRRTR
jgi:type IV secretion system protein VirB6